MRINGKKFLGLFMSQKTCNCLSLLLKKQEGMMGYCSDKCVNSPNFEGLKLSG